MLSVLQFGFSKVSALLEPVFHGIVAMYVFSFVIVSFFRRFNAVLCFPPIEVGVKKLEFYLIEQTLTAIVI